MIKLNPMQFAREVGRAIERGIEGGLKRAGLAVEKEAKRRAPVDTGSLRSSISSQPKGRGKHMVVWIGPNVKSADGAPYDVYQEQGTGLFAEDWEGRPVGSRSVIKPRQSKVLSFKPQMHGPLPKGSSRWKTTGKKGSRRRTKFHGDQVAVRSVRGTVAVHYMRKGWEAVNFETEFVRGFDAVR